MAISARIDNRSQLRADPVVRKGQWVFNALYSEAERPGLTQRQGTRGRSLSRYRLGCAGRGGWRRLAAVTRRDRGGRPSMTCPPRLCVLQFYHDRSCPNPRLFVPVVASIRVLESALLSTIIRTLN